MTPVTPQAISTAPDLDAIRDQVDADQIRARIADLDRERDLLRELLGVLVVIDGRRAAKAHFRAKATGPIIATR